MFDEKKKQGFFCGFSPGYTVKGPGGIEWSAKQGPEAQAEVTASRLVWALGFHQPPGVLPREVDARPAARTPGHRPAPGSVRSIKELDKVGEWGWLSNPFRARRRTAA